MWRIAANPTAGSYLWTISMVDIATGWWEGEVIPDRTQSATRRALDRIRKRLPFRLRELHPDNDTAILNQLLVDYCRQNQIALSRSRPLKRTITAGWNRRTGRMSGNYSAITASAENSSAAWLPISTGPGPSGATSFSRLCAYPKRPASAARCIAVMTTPLRPISGQGRSEAQCISALTRQLRWEDRSSTLETTVPRRKDAAH
jgi:hypothetical protein